MKRCKNRISLLIALLLCCMWPVAAFAAHEAPDLTRQGSLRVSVRDTESGKAVSGGELTLYKVAYVQEDNGGYTFVYTDDFVSCGRSLDDLNDRMLTGDLAAFAKEKTLRGTTLTIDENVNIPFSDDFSLPIRVHDTEGDLNVTKKSHDVDFYNGTLTYEIVVSSIHGTTDVVTLEDSMHNVVLDGDITVTKDGLDVTDDLVQLESGNLGLFQLPQMEEGENNSELKKEKSQTYKPVVDSKDSTKITANAGICTLTKKEDSTDYSAWAKKLDDRTYEIHIPKELANYIVARNLSGKVSNPRIVVYAYIEDDFVWDGLTHDFTNNVTVKYEKNEIGSSSQT